MFTYLYTFVVSLFYILSLPALLALSLKKKYRSSIPARFFLYKNPPFQRSSIYFHACSLGETKALAPLIQEFESVNLSIITQTGFEEAKKYGNADVRYLPFEPLLWWWLRPQKALVVMEAELWYLLFYLSKKRGAKTFLINARISVRSFPRYKRFAWLYRHIFANIDYVFAQREVDKERLEFLGAKNVEVVGNIKLLNRPKVTKRYAKNRPIIVAASTHDPEEEIIATDWVMSQKNRSTLVVVPRHPERFDEVDELLAHIAKREDLSYHRLSHNGSLDSDIVLVDTMGELINLYAVADLVILGGSFVPVGGHNPIEPAFFGVPIISGEHIFNQKEAYAAVKGIDIVDSAKLKEALQKESWQPTKIVATFDADKVIGAIKSVV